MVTSPLSKRGVALVEAEPIRWLDFAIWQCQTDHFMQVFGSTCGGVAHTIIFTIIVSRRLIVDVPGYNGTIASQSEVIVPRECASISMHIHAIDSHSNYIAPGAPPKVFPLYEAYNMQSSHLPILTVHERIPKRHLNARNTFSANAPTIKLPTISHGRFNVYSHIAHIARNHSSANRHNPTIHCTAYPPHNPPSLLSSLPSPLTTNILSPQPSLPVPPRKSRPRS
jgi:hypothetical protein